MLSGAGPDMPRGPKLDALDLLTTDELLSTIRRLQGGICNVSAAAVATDDTVAMRAVTVDAVRLGRLLLILDARLANGGDLPAGWGRR